MESVTNSRGGPLSIGQVARKTGVNIETIRYYERVKVLPAPPRTEGGRRVYGREEMRTLTFIRRGRELGFTLDEIRALLDLAAPGDVSCGEVKEIASAHLDSVRSKIADLKRLEALLAEAVAQCKGHRAPVCPVLEILQ